MKYLLIVALITVFLSAKAQSLNKSVNKDSLLKVLIEDLPEQLKVSLLKDYRAESENGKELLLFMISMPRSSKKMMVENIDSNYANINLLKTEYAKLVPAHYKVSIEFNPPNNNFKIKESIDLRITKDENQETTVSQEWQLTYDSIKLQEMLKKINWTGKSLNTIKTLLKKADCVSIENGDITEIGFARSGMGKYSYIFFNKDLKSEQIKQYNDTCMYIFYKKNIVLEYGGGARGPQCFPDNDK